MKGEGYFKNMVNLIRKDMRILAIFLFVTIPGSIATFITWKIAKKFYNWRRL